MAACCIGLGGCSGDDDRAPPRDLRGRAPPVPWQRLPEPTDSFEERICNRGIVGYATHCGVVIVPELPGSDRMLEIGVIRIFSNATDPAPDPIVYLEGGPGFPGSAAVLSAFEAFEPFLKQRDLVVVDQRGTGRSGDLLACSELDGVSSDDEVLDALSACSTRLEAEGINLSAYTTALSAADVDAARRAFGYEQWNLLGISYGTRLGLTILRDHPQGVRSAVLDSVVPLQADLIGDLPRNGVAAFEATFAACAAQPICQATYPSPMEQLLRVVSSMNESPVEVRSALVRGDDVVNLLSKIMYDPIGVGLVPWLIDELDQGEGDTLETLIGLFGSEGGEQGRSTGLHLSAHCAEEIPFTSREEATAAEEGLPEELVAGLSGQFYFDFCEAWVVPPAHPRENEPVISSVPTLVLSGGFDPITPPRYAALVHEDLDDSIFVNLENLSHGASMDPCGYDLVGQFYDAPGAPLGENCVAQVPAPEFEVPEPGIQSMTRSPGRRVAVRGPDISFVTSAPSEERLQEVVQNVQRRRALLR